MKVIAVDAQMRAYLHDAAGRLKKHNWYGDNRLGYEISEWLDAHPPVPTEALTARITAYLAGGGLFNPELANHDVVRDLLIDCREALARPLVTDDIEALIRYWCSHTNERGECTFTAEGIRGFARAIARPPVTDEQAVQELTGALREMIYETTHLSPCEADGSHWCKISGNALARARSALRAAPVQPTEPRTAQETLDEIRRQDYARRGIQPTEPK